MFKKMQIEVIKALETKSLEALINEDYFKPTLKYPMKLMHKPRLIPGHTSAQALKYAEALIVYEHDKIIYNDQLREYRVDAAAREWLFKWTCLYDIGAYPMKFEIIGADEELLLGDWLPRFPYHDLLELKDMSNLCMIELKAREAYLKAVEIVWTMAWDRGHSDGFYSVYQELLELNKILECFEGK